MMSDASQSKFRLLPAEVETMQTNAAELQAPVKPVDHAAMIASFFGSSTEAMTSQQTSVYKNIVVSAVDQGCDDDGDSSSDFDDERRAIIAYQPL